MTFNQKQIFKGESDNFLTVMKATGDIQSNGDSFYKISDEVKTTCKVQVI